MGAGAPRTFELGRVASVDPAKRRVRVKPLGRYGPLLEQQDWLRFAPSHGPETRLKVAQAHYRRPAGLVVAELAGGVPRDNVAGLKKARVVMPREKRLAATTDYLAAPDLLGCRVLDEDGREWGAITDAYAAEEQDILEIEGAQGRAAFPAVSETVAGSDLRAGVVTVRDFEAHAVFLDAG
jgi:ribosomal 30S subunit maturation factor RimM